MSENEENNSQYDLEEVTIPNPDKNRIITPSFQDLSSFYPFQRITIDNNTLQSVLRISLRTACTITLFPIRCILLTISIFLAYLIAKIALVGIKQEEQQAFKTLSNWRAMLVLSLRPIIRLTLFSLGFIWINESTFSWDDLQTNFQVTQEIITNQKEILNGTTLTKAHVIIANHLGYIDILILMYKYGGAFVAKESIQHAPIVGVVSRALQTLFLNSNKSFTELLLERVNITYDCHDAIMLHKTKEERLYDDKYYHGETEMCGTCLSSLSIFPEGTTTNGKSMVKFRTGIFLAKKRIQPITIELSTYPQNNFSLSWESIYFKHHLFYTMTQLYNTAQVNTLPIYNPTFEEQEDVHLFSYNVQLLLSCVLNQKVYLLNRKHKLLYHRYLLGGIGEEELLRLGKEEFEGDGTLVRWSTL